MAKQRSVGKDVGKRRMGAASNETRTAHEQLMRAALRRFMAMPRAQEQRRRLKEVRRRAGDPIPTEEEARRRRVQEIQSLPYYTQVLLPRLYALVSRLSASSEFDACGHRVASQEPDAAGGRDVSGYPVRRDSDPEALLAEFAYLHWWTFGLWDLINSHGYVLRACWPEPFRVALTQPEGTTDGRLIRGPSAHEVLRNWCVAALCAAQDNAMGGEPPWSSDPDRLEQRLLRFLNIVAQSPERARRALRQVLPAFDLSAWQQRLTFEVVAAIEKSGPAVQDLVEKFGRLEAMPRQPGELPFGADLRWRLLLLLDRCPCNMSEAALALKCHRDTVRPWVTTWKPAWITEEGNAANRLALTPAGRQGFAKSGYTLEAQPRWLDDAISSIERHRAKSRRRA